MVNPAQRLEKIRTEKNISRTELAAKLGFPKTSIEKFETGRGTPNKEQYEKLAKFFGVTVAYMKGESDSADSNGTWLSGNFKDISEEPVIVTAQTKKVKPVSAAVTAKEKEDGAVFGLLLKSEAFRSAVLEVLKTPEGQELIRKALKKI